MPFPLRQGDVALRYVPADGGAVGDDELHLAFRREADGAPHRLRQERVGRPAVDEEAHGCFRAGGAADDTLDVADAHAPEDGCSVVERRDRNIAPGGEDMRVLAPCAPISTLVLAPCAPLPTLVLTPCPPLPTLVLTPCPPLPSGEGERRIG